ncbi:MAG: hypothetical protein AB8G14_02800 [Ilumatobacter sp.]
MGDSPATTNAANVHDDSVEIAVPLHAEHASTLRVIVASLGADRSLNVDEIDDLKLAVSEVFTLMCDDAADVGATRAHVRFRAATREISIQLNRGLSGETFVLDALASAILASVVDSHVIDDSGITITKRAGATHS